jgi:hypothetical protein
VSTSGGAATGIGEHSSVENVVALLEHAGHPAVAVDLSVAAEG